MSYASHGHHEKGFVSINFKGVVMGMRIGGGQQAWSSQSSSVSNWQQRQQNFKALGSALQSGDLAGAQQAFATIAANNPAVASNPNSPLAQIGQALQSGNLAGAQQAAQAWRGMHGAQSAAAQTKASDAASAFLKTLTPLASTSTAANDPTATNATTSTTAATPSADQISQALMAFERNLFDSLQAQNTTASTSATTAATPAVATDPNAAATVASASTTASAATPAQGTRHHHHDGGGDAQLVAELNALISQTTSSTATSTATATATGTTVDPATAAPASALDQSFKNLLSTLGVTGNNASLNSFLQAMSADVQAA
jgi:hypothetical protein